MSYTHLLRNVSLFAQIRDDELDALAVEFGLQSFRKGQILFRQGSSTNSLYIVKNGTIQVTAFGQGGEITYVGAYGPDQYFGEFSLLDGLPRSGEAVALSNSDLLVLTRPSFFRFLENHPTFAIKLLVTVSRRMRFAEVAIDRPVSLTPEHKLIKLLIEVAEHYGPPEAVESNSGIVKLGLRFTSDDLAGLCGVTRDAANGVVSDLREANAIALERSYIVAVDMPKLRERLIDPATAAS